MELTPLAQLILKREGSLRPPVSKSLLSFSIPAEYERFLEEHDGSDGMDNAGWCFWGRSELRSIKALADEGEDAIPPECDEPEHFIVFADHLIYAGFLCFRLQPPIPETPIYYFFGFGALLPLARSWHDLHYAIEHEDHEAPFFNSLHRRCLEERSLGGD